MAGVVGEDCRSKMVDRLPRSYMVLGVVVGWKNGELMMAGVVRGDCRDK